MKTSKNLLVAAAFVIAATSCEQEESEMTKFEPNPVDTSYTSGANMNFKLNGGASFTYLSQGYGLICNDPASGNYTWALATGNNLDFDAATNTFSPDPNDTTFAVVWEASGGGIGLYTIPNAATEAFCFMQTPSFFRQYDASQLQINITSVTTDSIFGTYYGPLSEIIGFQPDPQGNIVPVYSGVVDSVATTFGVLKSPC